jgi:hypothetical protein
MISTRPNIRPVAILGRAMQLINKARMMSDDMFVFDVRVTTTENPKINKGPNMPLSPDTQDDYG